MLLHFVGLSNKKSHFPKRGHLVIQKQHWFAIHFQHENKNYTLAFIYQIKAKVIWGSLYIIYCRSKNVEKLSNYSVFAVIIVHIFI